MNLLCALGGSGDGHGSLGQLVSWLAVTWFPCAPEVVSATAADAFGFPPPHEPVVAGLPLGPMQMYVVLLTAKVALPPAWAISLPWGSEN